MVWFIPLLGAAATAIGGVFTYLDWQNARDMENASTQFQAYIDLLNAQMSPEEFFDAAWPSLFLIFGILLLGYIISTPRHPSYRRSRR